MHLKNITLINIGAYKGYNFINFDTSPNKNVILIGGENGSGKTTLLNAIKLGLFGSYGFGYKTENNDYYKHVESILNNAAKREKENDFSITIQFSIIENLKVFHYELKRQWNYINNSIKETVFLIKNNEFLDEQQIDLFNSKLKDIMPPQLLDLCLFDGEEIAKIITQNTLSKYIKKLTKVVFNLDLFETLEKDLDQYSKQEIDTKRLNNLEKNLFDYNNEEKKTREQIATTIRSIEYIEKELSIIQEEYQSKKNDFEKYGGLKKKEREKILQQISHLETERKHRADKIKQFVSTLLPLFLMKDLLKETREQIKNEESLQVANKIEEQLSIESLSNLLKDFEIVTDNKQLYKLKNQLVGLMKPSEVTNVIHGASFSESLKVEQAYNIIKKDLPNQHLQLLTQNAEELKTIQNLKNKVNVHDSTIEFSQIIEELDFYKEKILKLEQKLEFEKNTLAQLKQNLGQILEKIDKIKHQLHQNAKTSGSFLDAQKIIALSRKFLDIQIRQKLQDVQIQATRNLKMLLRKHDYISLIQINPEDFEVTLLDASNNELEKRTLSAGEKQILLLSIIWAIFKCSGRQVPFIFDTLLGRLDKLHKAAILNKFIPNFGKQTIILSTDSEIDQEHYKILSPYIALEYKLEFDPNKQQTSVHKDYFIFR